MSTTEAFREQLKVIAIGISDNVKNMLNMLTPEQMEQVIKDHKHFEWENNTGVGDKYLHLLDIERDGDKNEWVLGFGDYMVIRAEDPIYRFNINDLEIEDVLAFMCSIENLLFTAPLINEEA